MASSVESATVPSLKLKVKKGKLSKCSHEFLNSYFVVIVSRPVLRYPGWPCYGFIQKGAKSLGNISSI